MRQVLTGALLSAALIGFAGPSLAATVSYTYSGNSFDDTSFLPPEIANNLTSISATFEFAEAIAPNNTLLTILTPVSFVISDGHTTIDSTNSDYTLNWLTLGTDSTGAIIDWSWRIERTAEVEGELTYIYSVRDSDSHWPDVDIALYCKNIDEYGCGSNDAEAFTPGTWSSTAAAVPIPAAGYLFGSGLGLLGWFRRRQTA